MFGTILSGMDTVKEMEAMGSESGAPRGTVQIADCYDPTKNYR